MEHFLLIQKSTFDVHLSIHITVNEYFDKCSLMHAAKAHIRKIFHISTPFCEDHHHHHIFSIATLHVYIDAYIG